MVGQMAPTSRNHGSSHERVGCLIFRLQSATAEASHPIPGVRELEEAMAAAPVALEHQKRLRGTPTHQQPQAPAPVGYVPGVADLQLAMTDMPPFRVYTKRTRRDEEPASNQAVSAVTPPAAYSTHRPKAQGSILCQQ